ncbi:hypothetical protein NPX13_g1098 [Xylaria arbuscula]|uniref:Secreted protein n=1 Tax=Xylaria arbuscula TaxID=114810 RepID=A0A9W8NMP4_9PEZI|nr:hypothetical protein NPX13_g1098 [Xylaria arbuscula]
MKFRTILAPVAFAVMCTAYDVSYLPDGTYTVQVSSNGSADWNTVVPTTGWSHPPPLMRYSLSRVRNNARDNNIQDDEENESSIPTGPGSDDDTLTGGHCHSHWPKQNTFTLLGKMWYNKDNERTCNSLFMTWMAQGAEHGWIVPRELRFSKFRDVIVGACNFRAHPHRTCVHELNLAMKKANRDCVGGTYGCHVCIKKWGKDYFRFNAQDAPDECRCAWYGHSEDGHNAVGQVPPPMTIA